MIGTQHTTTVTSTVHPRLTRKWWLLRVGKHNYIEKLRSRWESHHQPRTKLSCYPIQKKCAKSGWNGRVLSTVFCASQALTTFSLRSVYSFVGTKCILIRLCCIVWYHFFELGKSQCPEEKKDSTYIRIDSSMNSSYIFHLVTTFYNSKVSEKGCPKIYRFENIDKDNVAS